MIPWSPVDPNTTLDELVNRAVVAFWGRQVTFLTFSKSPDGADRSLQSVWVESQSSTRSYREPSTAAGPMTLRSVLLRQGVIAEQILVVPWITWESFGQPYVGDGERRYTMRELIEHGPPVSVRRAAALEQVAGVKELYGRMLGDIAYRIENSALFDSAVATTRSFDVALQLWSDLDPEGTPEQELIRAAAVVKVTFDTARAHAETVGIAHLPDQARAEASRAAKAARLAAGAKTDAEREAAQAQVLRLLRSLALYYLPDPDGLWRALPGR